MEIIQTRYQPVKIGEIRADGEKPVSESVGALESVRRCIASELPFKLRVPDGQAHPELWVYSLVFSRPENGEDRENSLTLANYVGMAYIKQKLKGAKLQSCVVFLHYANEECVKAWLPDGMMQMVIAGTAADAEP
jgi:hypothetical protein